jgi:dTDP-4-dehydrorhamnose reductase
MSGKRILITGANGLLGQKLIDLYLNKPEKEILATGIGVCRHPKKGSFQYKSMDISNLEDVNRVFDEFKPNTVIHTAAMTNVDACELNKVECDRLNVQAVHNIVSASKAHHSRLIHISTDFIFDGTHGPVTEEEIPNPLSYYGHSKLKGEHAVMDNMDNWAILRTVLVYGVVNDMSRSNIVLWAKGALESGKPISVVDDQFRTPTLAEDLAMGCFLAEDQEAQGIYNISGKDFMSIYELVERVADYYQLSKASMSKSDSSTLNQAAKRPPITGFVLDKAKKELNYQPHSFEEGLEIVQQQLTIASSI